MPLFEVSYMCIPYIWAARLTRNVEVVGSSPIKGPRCSLAQETLPLLLSTGWFQERFERDFTFELK